MLLACLLCGGALCVPAQTDALARTRELVKEIQAAAYPELAGAQLEVKPFHSSTDYFQARFAGGRLLTARRMSYQIYVNPLVYERGCPETAVRAIIAHELAHVAFYRRRKRLQLLSLARLVNDGANLRFERGADLEAIARGYGAGLREYREWLYRNIPAEGIKVKQRDYFTPAEIDAITTALHDKPKLLDYWRKHVPRNLAEIAAAPTVAVKGP